VYIGHDHSSSGTELRVYGQGDSNAVGLTSISIEAVSFSLNAVVGSETVKIVNDNLSANIHVYPKVNHSYTLRHFLLF